MNIVSDDGGDGLAFVLKTDSGRKQGCTNGIITFNIYNIIITKQHSKIILLKRCMPLGVEMVNLYSTIRNINTFIFDK